MCRRELDWRSKASQVVHSKSSLFSHAYVCMSHHQQYFYYFYHHKVAATVEFITYFLQTYTHSLPNWYFLVYLYSKLKEN